MMNSIQFSIRLIGLLPKRIPLHVYLGRNMQYGIRDHTQFLPETESEGFFCAYLKDAIGRGIGIYRNPKQKKNIELMLSLPSTEEEITELFHMVERIRDYTFCTVDWNLPVSYTDAPEEALEYCLTFNLQILHRVMGELLNQPEGGFCVLPSVGVLYAGPDEAEHFWAGTNTDAFRDWLHEKQKDFTPEPELTIRHLKSDESVYFGFLKILPNKPVILPNEPHLPFSMYDPSSLKPRFAIQNWAVVVTDESEQRELAVFDFSRLWEILPAERYTYYDANHVKVDAISVEDWLSYTKITEEEEGMENEKQQ